MSIAHLAPGGTNFHIYHLAPGGTNSPNIIYFVSARVNILFHTIPLDGLPSKKDIHINKDQYAEKNDNTPLIISFFVGLVATILAIFSIRKDERTVQESNRLR